MGNLVHTSNTKKFWSLGANEESQTQQRTLTWALGPWSGCSSPWFHWVWARAFYLWRSLLGCSWFFLCNRLLDILLDTWPCKHMRRCTFSCISHIDCAHKWSQLSKAFPLVLSFLLCFHRFGTFLFVQLLLPFFCCLCFELFSLEVLSFYTELKKFLNIWFS